MQKIAEVLCQTLASCPVVHQKTTSRRELLGNWTSSKLQIFLYDALLVWKGGVWVRGRSYPNNVLVFRLCKELSDVEETSRGQCFLQAEICFTLLLPLSLCLLMTCEHFRAHLGKSLRRELASLVDSFGHLPP